MIGIIIIIILGLWTESQAAKFLIFVIVKFTFYQSTSWWACTIDEEELYGLPTMSGRKIAGVMHC
jgi:hypothetical protein